VTWAALSCSVLRCSITEPNRDLAQEERILRRRDWWKYEIVYGQVGRRAGNKINSELIAIANSITSFLLSSSQVECWRNTSILARPGSWTVNDIDSAGIILGLEVKDVSWP